MKKIEKATSALSKDKWWHRLSKVIYIALYIPLPFILVSEWMLTSTSYSYTSRSYEPTPFNAFWIILLTFVVYMIVVRLIKITFFYIAIGQSPKWKKEFKKIF